jgi:hypothetical protein
MPEEVAEMAKKGVDAIASDKPDILAKAEGEATEAKSKT